LSARSRSRGSWSRATRRSSRAGSAATGCPSSCDRGRPACRGSSCRPEKARSFSATSFGRARTLLRREDALPSGPHVHDLTLAQLELLARVARYLRPQLGTVVADELDAHLEAEVDDPLDHRLVGGAVRLEHQLEVVRAHPAGADAIRGADAAHGELCRGVLVQLPRRPARLDPAVLHADDLARDL